MSSPDRNRGIPRRALLGAAATLPVACLVPRPQRASVPPDRAAGLRAPDVDALLGSMTLDEKIGQMTQADRTALKDGQEIREYALGSILNGGDSLPIPNEPDSWAEMYDRYQSQALATRLGIPMIYGTDAVHGFSLVKGAVVFPHNIGIGCARSPELVEEIARVTAREVAGTGIDWAFAPCLAVPRDERWGRTYEGFAEAPELVATLGAAAIRGLQEAPGGAALLACAKHYVGDGGTTGGKDQGDTRLSEEDLRRLHMPGYLAAVKAKVGSVMVSYSSWNGEPMHGHRRLITDVLKGELAFDGFVVTDWEAIDKMPGAYSQDVETAINAGIDMVMVPMRFREFIRVLKELVTAGRVPMARIDDAVRRILRQKARFGLWERPFADRALTGTIGSDAHRKVARLAVQKSLVLLKNERAALPIKPGARVHLAGEKADDLGLQCGGWTVSWQGRRGRVTTGTTIREAFVQAAGASQIDFSNDASGAEKADVVVVVVGEAPYAEGKGDRKDLSLSADDRALYAAAKRSGKPVVVVLLSGRPLILGDVADTADAIVAAWLPGSEGTGVADVLFGRAPFSGKLSHSWPRAMADVPINVGDVPYSPLFPYGHGLTTT